VSEAGRGAAAVLAALRDAADAAGAARGRPDEGGRPSAALSGDPQSRLTRYFDTSVFSQPAAFTFGNTARLLPDVRGPGMANSDFAIFKKTSINERFSVEFRTEFFNIFNTPVFRHPGTALGTPQFGVISGTRGNPRLVQFGLRLLF